MYYLTAEEILLIHHKLIKRYGGSHGVRDLNRIKAVESAPKQHVFGQEQYKDIFEKAAVYARNIVVDHPFVDGNKRAGVTSATMFLKKNGYEITAKKGEVEDFAVQIAVEHLGVDEIAKWLKRHSI